DDPFLSDKRARQFADEFYCRIGRGLFMIGVDYSQNISCILYQSMLKSASRSDEWPTLLARKFDCPQSAFHAAVRATGTRPDRVAFGEPLFSRIVIETIRIHPNRFSRDSKRFSSVGHGLFGCNVIFVFR